MVSGPELLGFFYSLPGGQTPQGTERRHEGVDRSRQGHVVLFYDAAHPSALEIPLGW